MYILGIEVLNFENLTLLAPTIFKIWPKIGDFKLKCWTMNVVYSK